MLVSFVLRDRVAVLDMPTILAATRAFSVLIFYECRQRASGKGTRERVHKGCIFLRRAHRDAQATLETVP